MAGLGKLGRKIWQISKFASHWSCWLHMEWDIVYWRSRFWSVTKPVLIQEHPVVACSGNRQGLPIDGYLSSTFTLLDPRGWWQRRQDGSHFKKDFFPKGGRIGGWTHKGVTVSTISIFHRFLTIPFVFVER